MRVVDGHCHVSERWYEPVDSLLGQMDRNGVAQATLVQPLGDYDNAYLLGCVRAYPDRFVGVVGIDPDRADAVATLGSLAAAGATGLRLRPASRSPGADPLAIWRAAAELRVAVSCVGTAGQFASDEFTAVLDAVPELTVVLEHLGGSSIAGETPPDLRSRVFEAARYPGVCLKLPGLGELVPRPHLRAALGHADPAAAGREGNAGPTGSVGPLDVPEIAGALDRFGPDRLIWGSDFPVVSSREGYANALAWTRDVIDALAPDAVPRVFGATARRVFRLP